MEHDAVQLEGAMVSYINLTVAYLVYTWFVTFRGLSHLSVNDLGSTTFSCPKPSYHCWVHCGPFKDPLP